MARCVMMLMLAWPASSLGQADAAQPTLKQVLEEDVPAGEDAKQATAKKKPLGACRTWH